MHGLVDLSLHVGGKGRRDECRHRQRQGQYEFPDFHAETPFAGMP
jgi:hypothetical protein